MQKLYLCQKLLQEIADNARKQSLTHTEVIALGKIIKWKLLSIRWGNDHDEIEALLDFLITDSNYVSEIINHSQRSCIAKRILEFVNSRLFEKDKDDDDGFF